MSAKKKSEKIRLAFIVFFYLCCSSLQVLHKLNLHGKKGQLLHLTKKNETFKNRKVKQLFSSTLGFILQKKMSMTLQEFLFFFTVPQKSSQSFSIYDQDDQRPHVQALLRPLTSIMERYFFSTPKNFSNFFRGEKISTFFCNKVKFALLWHLKIKRPTS